MGQQGFVLLVAQSGQQLAAAQAGLAEALRRWVDGNQFWLGWPGRCFKHLIFRMRHGQMPANKGNAAEGANMLAVC